MFAIPQKGPSTPIVAAPARHRTRRGRTRPRTRFSLCLLGALAVLAAACGGASTSADDPPSAQHSAGGTGSSSPRQEVGLCSFAGPVPYPRVLTDGAPEIPVQFGIELAPASSSPMVAAAYRQFNTMRCTHYQHRYAEDQADGTYYYDCVGFTSYTLHRADPTAWTTLVAAVRLPAGYVPSPRLSASFFGRLASNPLPNWQAVPTAAAVLPGDLLAWSPSAEDVQSAGHAVLVCPTPSHWAVDGSRSPSWTRRRHHMDRTTPGTRATR